jgi:ABC-type multidrug transport system fused ATPase/permease subunit
MNGKTDDAKKPASKKTQQDIVNMFAVDCNSIAQFGAQNTQYVNVAGKFIISVVFLWFLIGWESLCAGLVGIVVLFPVNKALSSRYSAKQKNLMKIRDERTTITTEALQGIRQIKFSAIEKQWTEKLEQIREEELTTLWTTRLLNVYMAIGSEFTPILLTVLSLSTYSYIHGNLLPSVAFTAISLFMQIDGLVSHIPFLIVMAINAKVSCDRIEKFLRLPERTENVFPGELISFHDATVTFPHDSQDPTDDRFTLRELNLEFPNGGLSVISGPTGSGKSLLLAAILGEVELVSGYIQAPKAPSADQRFDSKATAGDWIIPSAISFVSQTPWIENDTIKNNVLFGLPYDPIRYEKVIKACALTQDFAIFEDGDQTEVGAQGISLSGGQKWRLTLARALYSRAGIMIMDDVFSAVDAHVGKHIYENAVTGELAEGRTRILVTHHVALCLPRAKYAVRLSARGTLEHAGLIEELKKTGEFKELLEADDTEDLKDVEEDTVLKRTATNGSVAIPSEDVAVAVKAPPKKLIEEEKRETGRVKTTVYAGYLGASGGWPFWTFLALLYAAAEAFTLLRTYWLKIWASNYGNPETTVHIMTYHHQQPFQTQFSVQPTNSTNFHASAELPIDIRNRNLWFYLGIYCFIATISVGISISRQYNVYAGSIRASRKMYKDMLHSVLRAPLRWLDTIPTGRILNRFTGDFTAIDSSLAQYFYYFAGISWEILGIMAAAVFVSPFMIIAAVILLGICTMVARSYVTAARTIKRLESTTKSPLISHFSASLSGLSTIRAFSKSPEFGLRMSNLIDAYSACSWYTALFRNWLAIRIGITASLFAALVAAFVITTRGIDASLAGFAMSFALNFGHCVSWAINISTQLELDMNAAERILEYRDLEIEKQDGEDVRASWPEEGKVVVKDLEVGYAADLPAILKGLTFTAEKNQRIGVVGRTGAGKSTLSLSIFRFLEARKGSITIDGVDISKIRLHDLRTRLAIIPQDPVLFSGTIRSNLDPFESFSDFQIREALMRVHLIPTPSGTGSVTPLPPSEPASGPVSEAVSGESSITVVEREGNANIFLDLQSPISSGGANLSQGQKQLLCLARAILSRPKVLLLDEATSAVDMATDILIQRSIREEFSNTTLLVVAHRLRYVFLSLPLPDFSVLFFSIFLFSFE